MCGLEGAHPKSLTDDVGIPGLLITASIGLLPVVVHILACTSVAMGSLSVGLARISLLVVPVSWHKRHNALMRKGSRSSSTQPDGWRNEVQAQRTV